MHGGACSATSSSHSAIAETSDWRGAQCGAAAGGESSPAARSCSIARVLPAAVPPRMAPSRHAPGRPPIHEALGAAAVEAAEAAEAAEAVEAVEAVAAVAGVAAAEAVEAAAEASRGHW